MRMRKWAEVQILLQRSEVAGKFFKTIKLSHCSLQLVLQAAHRSLRRAARHQHQQCGPVATEVAKALLNGYCIIAAGIEPYIRRFVSDRRNYSAGIPTALATLCNGTCYWPGCTEPVVVFVNEKPVNNLGAALLE